MRALELNGNGVRSLKFAKHEFYPLPNHKRDTDLEARLVERGRFNSLQFRPHTAFIMENLLTKFSIKSYQLTRIILRITAPYTRLERPVGSQDEVT